MKVVSDVLLLSYLDKICLTLTGELRRALACLYSEARLYKGAREASLSQSTTLHQGCGSGSVLDPYSIGSVDPGLWIRIRIRNPDPDPGGQK
jgi:hypothetical protein